MYGAALWTAGFAMIRGMEKAAIAVMGAATVLIPSVIGYSKAMAVRGAARKLLPLIAAVEKGDKQEALAAAKDLFPDPSADKANDAKKLEPSSRSKRVKK
jgi:hypothetical protein